MKGDFTRDTFKPDKHYQQVLMQQGRVQLDADWNEQSAIATHRDETMLADIVGNCGGPANGAAFAIITDPVELAALPPGAAETPPRQFGLSPGRYYVEGLQCEVESPFLFSWQPDHREPDTLAAGDYLVYLDVWRRHLTLHEDQDIREAALGGPDTATRVKTVWQVRVATLDAALDPSDPCQQSAADFDGKLRTVLPRLAAKSTAAASQTDPCLLPAGAGYRGLENQLYRVEVHAPGGLDAATFKWSRENGAVVTPITASDIVNGERVVNVASLGPDEHLGFNQDDLVEIIHEVDELEGNPGALVRVSLDDTSGKITLKPIGADPIPTIDLNSNPRLRRWEDSGVVTFNLAENEGYLPLDNGIEIRFDLPVGATFRTGDYWQIPARTASADALSGKIEWPGGDVPELLPPRGITHHYCRLGVVSVDALGAVTTISDCRCLWPALTAVPRMFYVGGDGQEVMPDLTAPAGTLFKLPQPLIVGIANPHCLEHATSIRFEVVNTASSSSDGMVAAPGDPPTQNFADVPLDTHGLAKCDFHLDGVSTTQQVIARLLDDNGNLISLPIIFSANLSIASQVAYQPGDCEGLAAEKTVQDAIARLASMASLHKLSGDGQQGTSGASLQPLIVLAANRCGPLKGMKVNFTVVSGGGTVTPASATTNEFGLISCDWKLGNQNGTLEVEAELFPDSGRPVTEPRKVRFSATMAGDVDDPAPVRIVGVRLRGLDRDLPNDDRIRVDDLGKGIDLLCDQSIDIDTVQDPAGLTNNQMKRGQPTCFVTAEIPFPSRPSDITDLRQLELSMDQLIGYVRMVLHADVRAVPDDSLPVPGGIRVLGRIRWAPNQAALSYLKAILRRLGSLNPRPDGILLRLTLKGNFIWSEKARELIASGTPGGFLDGETFRATKPPNLLLPSGDNRRGGDFEMWFWIVES